MIQIQRRRDRLRESGRVVSVGFRYRDGETGLEREGESCQCRVQIQRRRDRV